MRTTTMMGIGAPSHRTSLLIGTLASLTLGLFCLLTGPAGHAGTGCNLTPHPTVTPCATPTPNPATCSGCSTSSGIQHPGGPPCGGSFDLRGSEYDATCGTDACPTCTRRIPPLRIWDFDTSGLRPWPLVGTPAPTPSPTPYYYTGSGYMWANHGRVDQLGGQWLANGWEDTSPPCAAPAPPSQGMWYLWLANWYQPTDIDGCPGGGAWGRLPATVAEISEPYPALEGTNRHASWYLLASAYYKGVYDFTAVTGGDLVPGAPQPCQSSPAVIRRADVPGLTIDGRTLPCVGDSTVTTGWTENAVNANYFDVKVHFANPVPAYFTEAGMLDPADRLIEGYQVVYMAGSEPLTSVKDPLWQPVRDPADPANRTLRVVPFGARTAIVSLLKGGSYYLATRLVYTDCSLNAGLLT